jgi:hypothetical protein
MDFEPAEELVGVSLIREDLRQLLLASRLYADDVWKREHRRLERLELAISRVRGTASGADWQPKPPNPDE